MTQDDINQIKNVLQTWGAETVSKMLSEFEKDIYYGRDKTQTDLYQQFHPQLVSDVQTISWILTLPGYAENVDKGRASGKYPSRDVIEKWAKARGLPMAGTTYATNHPGFWDITRKIVYDRGIPRVDFFKYFTTEPDNRVVELQNQLYITIGNILENDIIKITRTK